MSPAIETRGLSKRFRRTRALVGIDLLVPEGSIFGFLGPNGAGKSTTMKILMGLIRRSGGEAYMLGRDVRDGVPVRSRVGYLPQDPHFYERMKVRSVLAFVAGRYLTGSRAAISERVEEVIELVGLQGKENRRVKALSGGELRRLGIAQAYIGRPELLILDEPSVGLDPAGRREVIDLLESLRGETTIFYSTHILDDVQRVADHIAVLDRGQVLAQGPIEDFRSSGQAAFTVRLGQGAGEAVAGLGREEWVSAASDLGDGTWRIESPSRDRAERELARHLVATGASVQEIRPDRLSLEEIYLQVTAVDDSADIGSEEVSDDD